MYTEAQEDHSKRIAEKLNSLPEVKVLEASDGSGKDPFKVTFECGDIETINMLTWMFDRRYGKCAFHWTLKPIANAETPSDKICFLLISMSDIGEVIKGKEAYIQMDSICDTFDDFVSEWNPIA